MNPLRYFDYPVHLTSAHQHLVDHSADPAPAPRCVDLVWQALHCAQGMARQALRYLDCRPCLPSDTLEAPAAAHQPEPMMPPAQAERAAEEPPHSAPALPVAPASLKSVLLPPDHAKRTRSVRFAENLPTYKTPARVSIDSTSESESEDEDPGHSLPTLLNNASCLDFSLLNTPTKDAATAGFEHAVQEHVFSLQSHEELWNNPRLNLGQRIELVLDCKKHLQELRTLVRDLMKALRIDPKARVDAAEINKALFQKRIELAREIRRADELITQCKQALEAENNAGSESDSSDVEDGLDFSRISHYSKGDTQAIVRSMYDPLVALVNKLCALKHAALKNQSGSFDWQLSAQSIVTNLNQMEDLLMDHVLAYGGRNREFVQWISDKSDALKLERLGWERKLARYSF